MPIIPVNIRFILITVCLIGGIGLSFVEGGLAWSWMLLVPGIILLFGYFFLGTLASTSKKIQEGDFEGAKAQLALTKKPEWLLSFNKGIYHFLKGSIAMQEKDWKNADVELKKALDSDMPSADYKAQIYLGLLGIASQRRNIKQAKEYLTDLKKLKVSDPNLLAVIQDTENQLKRAQGNPRGVYPQQGGRRNTRRVR